MTFTPAILQRARSRRPYPNCILKTTVQIADWIIVLFMSLWRVVYRSVLCFGRQRIPLDYDKLCSLRSMFTSQSQVLLLKGVDKRCITRSENCIKYVKKKSNRYSICERTTKQRKCRTSELNEVDRIGVGLLSKPKFAITLASTAVTKRPVHKALISSIALFLHSRDRHPPMLRYRR